MPPVLALLTDFGSNDGYVAAIKAVVLAGLSGPALPIVDIGHEVEPGDIEGAALLLADVHRFFPPATVFLVVVDPGVGSERRLLAVEAGGRVYLGPDNGVLEPALATDGSACWEIGRSDRWLSVPGPGSTFHGRDRLAPTAAALLEGLPPSALGPPLDDPRRLDLRPPRRQGSTAIGRIVRVDRFGNAVTDIPGTWLPAAGAPCTVRCAALRIARRVDHYDQIPPGELAVLIGSAGTLEISMRRESAARRHGLRRGATVELIPGPGGAGDG